MSTLIGSVMMALGVLSGNLPQVTPTPATTSGQGDLELEPTEVQAGMFFDGAKIQVSATVPSDVQLTISCIGTADPVVLSRKGKALGLIWMNVGEVEVGAVPDVYLLHTSERLTALGSPSALSSLGVGYEALRSRITITGADGDEDRMFREFVSLKESDGLYGVVEKGIQRRPTQNGLSQAQTELTLPAKTPPGEYIVRVHGFQGGEGFLLAEGTVRVEQVGLAAAMGSLSVDHGLAYGILAVVVAVVVGLLTGVLFGLGSKKAH